MEWDWMGCRVVITGGTGFLGRHLYTALRQKGALVTALSKNDCDLRYITQVVPMMRGLRPALIFHLAAKVAGIHKTSAFPAEFIYDNLTMGLNLAQAAVGHARPIPKIVMASSVCAYPNDAPMPMHEDALWGALPEESNASYGIAKRTMLAVLDAYQKQYGLKAAYLLLANLYGPGDHFDSSSHVIPALIQKVHDAQLNGDGGISVWGSGTPTRSFLYVKDAVRALILAAENNIPLTPINIGTMREISIASLAELICGLMDFGGEIAYDRTKPDGQMRRDLDTGRARQLLGFWAEASLEAGLRETIDWYRHEHLVTLKEDSCDA